MKTKKSANKVSLTRKVALVTGGAVRIGQAISLKLAELGFDIALHYHQSKEEALKTAQYIRKKGRVCELFFCDLANEHETSLLIQKTRKKFKNLSLLVNNASVFNPSIFKKISLKQLNEEFAINFKAPFILMRDFANQCPKGEIINLLDTNIAKNTTEHFTYLLTKKALHELTKLAAMELAPSIRVNAIAPGAILAPANNDKTYLKRVTKNIPLKRMGDVTQITKTIEFLLKNDYLTGEVVFVDGGEHLWLQSA